MSELPEPRDSDADRERVAEVLRDALTEGCLDREEFDERLGAAYQARTYAELEPLTRDLPAAGVTAPLTAGPAAPGAWADRAGDAPTCTVAVAVMSGFQRKGRWTVPRGFTAFAFWGGGIDRREAR